MKKKILMETVYIVYYVMRIAIKFYIVDRIIIAQN